MKLAQSNSSMVVPASWEDIPCGAYYRQMLEQGLKAWWPKLFGFHLLKIGALSADLDTGDCLITNQVNVGLEGNSLHVIADPYKLPFANKSTDACLLAHTLSYISDPCRLLKEIDRVLIDDGWLIISMFNSMSMLGFWKICPILFRCKPYRRRMYTQMQLLNWLRILNFEVLHCTHLQMIPWRQQSWRLPNINFLVIGYLSVIVSRKRTLPLNIKPLKNKTCTQSLRRPINAITHNY